jgi:DTW domain-containing protein YfiP
MYYHFQELGRSANTAHIFESMNSTITERVVFGDSAAELKLVEQIHEEIRSSRPRTCVLYPDRSAKKLSDWIASRPTACRDTSVRLVALDGTYGQASRQWKYLSRCLHELHGEDLPVVKLDLEDGKCRSAIAGVMAQPGKEKICTYQAVVMAVRQVKRALDGERRLALGEAMNNCKAAAATTTIDGNTTTAILAAGADGMCMNTGGNQVEGEDAGEDAGDRELFQYLDFTLERFLLHILKHRVRMGKRSNRAIEDVDYTPSDQLREHLVRQASVLEIPLSYFTLWV